MNEFTELLLGTFANKRQAQSHPTRYAHIRVSHRLIGGNRVYGEQAYNYLLNRPYRQFVIDVVQQVGLAPHSEEYHLKNYEIINPLQFAECKNLDKISDDILKYREGCDVIMRKIGNKTFFGGTSTCECWVTWNGTKTYVQNEVKLTDSEYQVTDKGLHAESHTKVWGSDYGAFRFLRQ